MPFNIDKKISDLAQIILTDLKMKELTLATAESATGGFLSHIITNIPGSSKNFLGGIVCYSAEAKNVLSERFLTALLSSPVISDFTVFKFRFSSIFILVLAGAGQICAIHVQYYGFKAYYM